MREASKRRQAPRYELIFPVRYQARPEGKVPQVGSGQTRDLGETGARLDLPEHLPQGTFVSLVLEGEAGSLAVEATVVWSERVSRPGGGIRHGVAFAPLSPEDQQRLRALLQRHGAVRSRIAMLQPMPLRVRATLQVRLLDLSMGGARIEHRSLLRPGSECLLEFPAAFGPLALSAQVLRSTIVGVEEEASGGPRLRHESGLAFVNVTADQRTALTQLLGRLGSGEGLAGVVTVP